METRMAGAMTALMAILDRDDLSLISMPLAITVGTSEAIAR